MYSFAHVTNISGSGHENNFCNFVFTKLRIFSVFMATLFISVITNLTQEFMCARPLQKQLCRLEYKKTLVCCKD